ASGHSVRLYTLGLVCIGQKALEGPAEGPVGRTLLGLVAGLCRFCLQETLPYPFALFGRAIDSLGPGQAHRAEKSGKLHRIGSMPWNRHAHKIQFCPFWVRLGHQWLVSRGTEEGPAQPQNPIGLGPGSLTVHPPWGLAAFPWKPRLHRSASQPED